MVVIDPKRSITVSTYISPLDVGESSSKITGGFFKSELRGPNHMFFFLFEISNSVQFGSYF